jgi:hypothetical protein
MLFVVKMHEVYLERHEEVAIRPIAHRGTEGTEGECKVESGKLEIEIGNWKWDTGGEFSIRKIPESGDSSRHLQTGLRVAREVFGPPFGCYPNNPHRNHSENSVHSV